MAPLTRLVLVGGGHSQIHALQELARRRLPDLDVTLISREVLTPYSGMLPGVVAGHYAPRDALIDLAPLCAAAGVNLVQAEVDGLDLRARTVSAGERSWPYDLLSINCGSAPGLATVTGGAEAGVPVKPISAFLPHWEQLLARLAARESTRCRIAVVGGGAGGVEMALALHHRLRQKEGLSSVQITLLDAGARLLTGHAPAFARRVSAILSSHSIPVQLDTRIERADAEGLVTTGGERLGADEVLWALTAGAQSWPGEAGLAVDDGGFVKVDAGLRSLSHPEVFASGDMACFTPRPLPKAGVFAVRQGPVLAGNLLRAAQGQPLKTYRPQSRYLTLLSTGSRYAVAARGGWTAEGAWAWRWKDWIDRRFVRRFQRGQLTSVFRQH